MIFSPVPLPACHNLIFPISFYITPMIKSSSVSDLNAAKIRSPTPINERNMNTLEQSRNRFGSHISTGTILKISATILLCNDLVLYHSGTERKPACDYTSYPSAVHDNASYYVRLADFSNSTRVVLENSLRLFWIIFFFDALFFKSVSDHT